MSLFNRIKKPNWSETGAKLSRVSSAFGGLWTKLRTGTGPLLRNLGPTLRGKIASTRQFLRENFPRNVDELKEGLQKLQSGEALDRIRKISGGSSGTYLRLGAAAFAAYFLADTVSLFTDSLIPDPPVVPPPPIAKKEEKRRSIEEYAAIVSRNVFNSKGIIPDEDENPGNGPARKTNLPLNLIGTIVLKNELKSIATIEDKSQNLVFPVRVDETINDKIKITKIEHLKVYFINRSTGALEYVEIVEDLPQLTMAAAHPTRSHAAPPKPAKDGVTQKDETSFEIDRGRVDKTISNLSQVLQEARAIPNFENGMPDGYKILQIVPGSIYDQLGVKNGDVISGLNGEPINDPGKAFQLFNELKTTSHLEITVKRGGRKMTMNYDIR